MNRYIHKVRYIPTGVSIFRSFSINIGTMDHICLCVSDIEKSIIWYHNILGVTHKYNDTPNFYPYDLDSPAFLQKNDVKIALLPLHKNQSPIKDHKGAHIAFNTNKIEFSKAKEKLPGLLIQFQVHADQSIEVEECDYGIQKSLFFADPDNNILEVTTWCT